MDDDGRGDSYCIIGGLKECAQDAEKKSVGIHPASRGPIDVPGFVSVDIGFGGVPS